VALVDIDRLRELNEARGRAAGDAALRTLAAALRATLRGSDHVGRYGGDEFLITLPACDEAGRALRRAAAAARGRARRARVSAARDRLRHRTRRVGSRAADPGGRLRAAPGQALWARRFAVATEDEWAAAHR